MVEGMLSKAFCVLAATLYAVATVVYGQEKSCYFIFGDSLFDCGNNNKLQSKAKVDYPPYGIDFPKGPTGRFTNGRTIADVIGELLGFKDFIPPFAEASPEQAKTGLNYASGGAGLVDETSKHLGGRISLKMQIENHKNTTKKARLQTRKLQNCLYAVNIGSNDYINNYFMPKLYTTSRLFDPKKYASFLDVIYRTHLKNLHRLGARKVVIFGLSPIGCTPKMRVSHGGSEENCADEVNDAVAIFNKKLEGIVKDFNKRVRGAKYTFVNLHSGGKPLTSSSRQGFKVGHKGCCTLNPGEELCAPNGQVCTNRNEYIFWDDIHSTEATNTIVAKAAFHGIITKPYSISQLMKK